MPTLRGMADQAAPGCLLKPLFHKYVMDAAPQQMSLLVSRPVQREPDGWFHASQHPLATDRELWLWMQGRSEPEPPGYVFLMSVMFGSLAHAVFGSFTNWMGVSVPLAEGDCPACGRPRRPLRSRPNPAKYCTEHGFTHAETRARCHLDDILDFDGDRFGLDFKTIRAFGLKGVPDMNAEYFREKWPKYWAQMQECMRLSGLRRYIVFFLSMGMPWEVREFHLEFDPGFAAATEAKYLAVLHHFSRGEEILL